MITFKQEQIFSELSNEEQIKKLKQFFIAMMDWNEQTEKEKVYIYLYDCLEKFEKGGAS